MSADINLTGKELEELVLYRASVDEGLGKYTLGRYGVMATFRDGQWAPITSLPDFEGSTPDGRQFMFDAKTCSQSSYDMTGSTSKSFKNQYRHLQRRSAFGVTCFMLMHFNARTLKTKHMPSATFAIPIRGDLLFWQAYDAGSQKSITRNEAEMYGVQVQWNTATERSTKLTPDILDAINRLRVQS